MNDRHYALRCTACERRYDDDGCLLTCPAPHEPAYLRTEYAAMSLRPCPQERGLFRYREWLPIREVSPDAPGTLVYRSAELGRRLGLGQLWIAFHGYWPDRGAFAETGTFKELEAAAVLGRRAGRQETLVVSSAGNTAAAFAAAGSRSSTPCLLVVPETMLGRLSARERRHPHVRLISLGGGADYTDAIAFAGRLAALPGFEAEGGGWNVARRDGLATVMLAAYEAIGRTPDHYFQAVGSGVGAIAAHEAAVRLGADPPPRLVLCQNDSCAPLYRAWLSADGAADDRERARTSSTPELTNRQPPYLVRGGVRDALKESGGVVTASSDAAATAAMELFLTCEGIDIERPAAFALAALREEAEGGLIPRDAVVLLNVTGGGRERFRRDHRLLPAAPDLRLTREQALRDEALETVHHMCESGGQA
ncbi:cysteate synthase [Nonomuraea pusilla]|uniref:Cysteate synthase n=1 Tax=Nonomuraea pusilla TaxID=46177 RepID=A0A1H7I5P8_9ACTN|nr:cysteate synthase [Nonomuraea pusilla]SEK57849.1 cysteate synthase [Nonomuraea pusilla]